MTAVMFLTDGRLAAASRQLSAAGHRVICAGNAEEGQRILQLDAAQVDFVVLPIRGTNDGTVEFETGKLFIDPLLKGLRPKIPVFTGRNTEYLLSLGLNLHNCFEDVSVAGANALLTAEGVLWMLLGQTPCALTEYTYDVLGLGKTGTCICSLLQRLGLCVRSITRDGRNGSLHLAEWEQGEPADVVIVTIPSRVLSRTAASQWTKPVTVIDITSGQAGADASIAEESLVTYFAAPPLPGIVAPETAGRLIARFIMNTIGRH